MTCRDLRLLPVAGAAWSSALGCVFVPEVSWSAAAGCAVGVFVLVLAMALRVRHPDGHDAARAMRGGLVVVMFAAAAVAALGVALAWS